MNDIEKKLAVLLATSPHLVLAWDCSYEEAASDLIKNGVTIDPASLRPKGEWISVKDRLPEENGIYLTCNKKRQYEFHMFQPDKRMWQGIWQEDGVTHWTPLPEPPNCGADTRKEVASEVMMQPTEDNDDS